MEEAATESGADEPGIRSERLIGEVCMEECLSELGFYRYGHAPTLSLY